MATAGFPEENTAQGARLGLKLKEARREARMSQAELGRRLAQALGRRQPFSQAAISDMERGDLDVALEYIQPLSEILGTPLEYFRDTDPASPQVLRGVRESGMSLRDWKYAMGLPEEFPWLTEIPEEKLSSREWLYFGDNQQKALEDIDDSTSAPLTLVTVNRGHGCTTLARYVYKHRKAEKIRNRQIPVLLNVNELLHGRNRQETLNVAISSLDKQVADSLQDDPWEIVVPTENIKTIRTDLVSKGDLKHSTRLLISSATDKLMIRVNFIIDCSLSAGLQPESIAHLVEFLSGIRRGMDHPERFIETYFVPSNRSDDLEFHLNRPTNKIQFPWYSSRDIQEMLARRYPRNRDAFNFLNEIAKPNLPINDTVELLESKLKEFVGELRGEHEDGISNLIQGPVSQ